MKTQLHRLPLFCILFLFSFQLSAQSDFWGTTRWGGTYGMGVVFKTNNDGTNPQMVYSFSGGADGGDPHGGLIQAGNGKLYGTTFLGGDFSNGVLYEIDPVTGTFTKKIDFDSLNTGSKCMGTLFKASNGMIYGMTSKGGTANEGVLFEYDIVSNSLSKIIDLDGPVYGSDPYSNTFMQASNGKLYGTTPSGGANGNGVLLEYDLTTSTVTNKVDFQLNTTGSGSGGRLTEVAPGILYGATSNGGGSGGGVIYEYNISSNILTNKFDLSFDTTGSNIYDGLMLASNGRLYGLAHSGGPGYAGTMIEYDIALDTLTDIVDFGTIDTTLSTWEPYGSPMQASNGKIYGTSAYGINGGNLFEYDFNTDTYTSLVDFDPAIGANTPYYLRLVEINIQPGDVWPGDCNYDLTANNVDFLYLGLAWNETGPPRNGGSTNWIAQPASPWAGSFPSLLNHKHADTNGDGIVNVSDSGAIYQNYGMTHPLRMENNSLNAAGELTLVPGNSAVAPGQPVIFEIHLSDLSAPLTSLYGIAFTLNFDPALVDTTQLLFDFSPSVLGNFGVNMISFEKNFYTQGSVDVAITRTDQLDASNVYGVLGTFTVTTNPGVSNFSNLVIAPSDITCVNTSGSAITLVPVEDSVSIDPSLSGIADISDNMFSVYPNPADNAINFISSVHVEKIEILNQNGKVVYKNEMVSASEKINVEKFSNGIYTIIISSAKGRDFRKIAVCH